MAVNATELAQNLVRMDSSDPGAYEGAIEGYLKLWLEERVARAGLADTVAVEELEALPGRRCIKAELPGRSSGPALAFVCHMDTVTLGDGWSATEPLSGAIEDGRLWGRGSCDMKSGLACALAAFDGALAQTARRRWEDMAHRTCACSRTEEEAECDASFSADAPWLPLRTLKLVLTVDEEDFMRGIEAVVAAGWIDPGDWLLDTEPTDGRVRVAHKGRLWFEFEAEGVTAHASTPWRGADAIAAMAEAVVSLRNAVLALPEHPELGRTTVTFGQIEGGYRPYVVPDHCKLWVDIRHVPPATSELLCSFADKAAASAMAAVPGTTVSYAVTGDRPPVERDPQSGLVAALERVTAEVTGEPAAIDVFTGYTDTAVCAGTNGNTEIASYGPGSLEMAHKPDESVPLDDISRCERVLSALVEDICFEG